jgi:Cholesterol oxidase, substrate-binding
MTSWNPRRRIGLRSQNTTTLAQTIPAALDADQAGSNFASAAAAFDAADPYRIFSNTFLDTLLP